MTPTDLLAELSSLTHHDRIRRMVDLGRQAKGGDVSARATIAELGRSDDAFVRRLALESVFGSRDGAMVLMALTDRSRTVRGRALRLLAIACSDEEVRRALSEMTPGPVLTSVVVALRRQGRGGCVDAVIAARLAAEPRPDVRVVDLLPFASAETVNRNLPQLRDRGGDSTWCRLARAHPAIAAVELSAALARSDSSDVRLRYRLRLVLDVLVAPSSSGVDEALALVRLLVARGENPTTHPLAGALRVLARRRPAEVFDLLRARQESGPPAPRPGLFGGLDFGPGAPRLGAERLAFLVEHAATTLPDGRRAKRWFSRLSEAERAALLDAWLRRGYGTWGAFLFRHLPQDGPDAARREERYVRWSYAARNNDGVIAPTLLEALPADLRHREARRHLSDVSALQSKPRERCVYAGLLPFNEARVVLASWLGHPEGEERAAALSVLLGSVRFDRARLPAALDFVHARRFEQDPVRLAMLQALGALPPGCYRLADLEALGLVLRDALDAADLSYATGAAVERLVVRLFRVDANWGARWLSTLLETRGSVSTFGLATELSEREVRAIVPVLGELTNTWATRERAGALIWLATSFGRRLRVVTPLLDALVRLASELPFAGVAAAALNLLRREGADRFRALVPALLASDASYAILPVVARYVSMHRQDLLGPLLGDRPMKGRFATGRTHWVIDFGAGYARWTSAQQRIHAEATVRLLEEEKREVPSLRFAIDVLTRLAFAPAEHLLRYAADRRPPVREMAVRALPWLDAGQGVETLLECLGDDRARWAIYALRKAFSEMPPSRSLAILRAAPTSKVTVAKEIVRLLGELPGLGDAAYRALLEMDRPDLHRDVRIALLRAHWDHLDREETWAIFERAAADPDWVLASRLADIPLGRLSPELEARVVSLLARLLARPEPEARLALLLAASGLPLCDEKRQFFDQLLAHLGARDPSEATAALRAVLARMRTTEVAAVVARFAELLPRRRTLDGLLRTIEAGINAFAPPHHRGIADGLLAVLASDRLLVLPYVRLAGKLLDHRALGDVLIALSSRDLLHADAMNEALTAVRACVHPELLEARLADQSDPTLRRLALAALCVAAAPEHGWTPARVERLRVFRRDPAPLVAAAANWVFPPEDEPEIAAS